MCIALLSTAHPSYRLILIDNRDEYLNRPTAPASWWPDQPHVLGGRDLLREVHGTWLGVTKQGKIAVLTNFREDTTPPPTAVSRGAIIRKWLAEDVGTTEQFVHDVVDTGVARDAGGFSLVCGNVGEKLAVISNRAEDQYQVPWICGDVVQTIGLSNAAFLDHSWKKVRDGEELMLNAIRQCVEDGGAEDDLIKGLLGVLSVDSLPRVEGGEDDGLDTYITQLRNTILVPPLGRRDLSTLPGSEWATARKPEKAEVLDDTHLPVQRQLGVSGLYGTQKQTVVLIDHEFNVRFFERTLFDGDPKPVPLGTGDVDVRFKIDAAA